MGKLKEKLLNNLTPEEQNEMFELSAFEFVEYMENYKNLFDENGNPIPNDVLEQIAAEREQLENDFYSQSDIDEINDSIELKYSDSDVIQAIKLVKDEGWFINRVLKELRVIHNNRKGFE